MKKTPPYIFIRIEKLVLVLVILVIFSSCKKQKQLNFLIANKTSFRIDKIDFNTIDNSIDFSIEPNGYSSEFSLTYNERWPNFSDVIVRVTIKSYSDSITHECNEGRELSSKNITNEGTNYMEIQLETNPNFKTTTFNIISNGQ